MNPAVLNARNVLRALVQGTDPENGLPLAHAEVIHRPAVIRALAVASEALGSAEVRAAAGARQSKAQRGGEPWTPLEDEELRDGFGQGVRLSMIAKDLRRTEEAVAARLVRLGVVQNRQAARSRG